MMSANIRRRMLTAALLPLVLICTLAAAVFFYLRFDDLRSAHQMRNRLVARQLALASEHALFTANLERMQPLLQGMLREADVRSVAVLDSLGQVLLSVGESQDVLLTTPLPQEETIFDEARGVDVVMQPVFASQLELDDLYEAPSALADPKRLYLGHVVVNVSRRSLEERIQNMLLLGGSISLLALFFAVVLALHLSQGVLRPLLALTGLIERIGRSNSADLADVPAAMAHDEPLNELYLKLQHMAARLADTRADLERQVTLATQAMREKMHEAEHANQVKSRFLASASHDLRQPVHALGLFVARLAQLPHDVPTRHLIAHLEDAVRAIQELLDGLLDLSRLEAHAVTVRTEDFPLMALFERLQQDLGTMAHEKGLRLCFRPSPVWVRSDPALLYRILLNLVSNALRYTEHGTVLVACRRQQASRQVRIEVWDTGLGIAPEYQQAVFGDFFQVDNPSRDRHLGMGLGLSIVQRTCKLLGHSLKMRSRPGKGTYFGVQVPWVAARQPELTDAAPTPAPLPELVVLVIDDDELAREALVGLLQSWGHEVRGADGLAGALALIRDGFQPALVLCDYRLRSTAQGIEVIALLRQALARPVAACLISGDIDAELIQAARAAGLTLLHKPLRPAKLRTWLRHCLMAQEAEPDLK